MNTVIIVFATLCLQVSVVKKIDGAVQHAELQTSVKRADGLMRDLVNLLNEEKDERKVIRSDMQTNKDLMTIMKKQIEDIKKTITRNNNGINKVVKQVETTENRVKKLAQDTSNQFVDVWKEINKMKAQIGTIVQLKTHRVGFTVSLGTDKNYKVYDQKYLNGQIIVFKNVITNYGHYYNKQKGKFLCRVSGLYIFQLHVISNSQWSGLWIVKNGQRLSRTSATNKHWQQNKKLNKLAHANGDVSLVIRLTSGDQIWVESPTTLEINHTTYFSGALVSL